VVLAAVIYSVKRARSVVFPLFEHIWENRPEQNPIVAAPSCDEIAFRYLLKHTDIFLLHYIWLIWSFGVSISLSRFENCIDSRLSVDCVVILLLGQLIGWHFKATCLNQWDHFSDLRNSNHVTSCIIQIFFWYFRLFLCIFFLRNSRSGWRSLDTARKILFVSVAVFKIVPGRYIRFTFVLRVDFEIIVGVLALRMVLRLFILEHALRSFKTAADQSPSILTMQRLFGLELIFLRSRLDPTVVGFRTLSNSGLPFGWNIVYFWAQGATELFLVYRLLQGDVYLKL